MKDTRHLSSLQSYTDYGMIVPLTPLIAGVLNLCQKAPCHMTRNFYAYMNILEDLLERGKYQFYHHDVMMFFASKRST